MANLREISVKAQQIQEEAAIQAEAAKTALSEDTMKLIQRARWHHDHIPFTNLPDSICTFKVTYVTFYQDTFVAQGVIWPYKKPDKAANFLFLANGKQAHYNISDVMERCNSNFKQQREVYRIQKKMLREVKYPLWTEPVQDVLIDEEFTVKAHHYNGQLQLDFASWRFKKDIDRAEMEFRLKATDPELRMKRGDK